MVLIESLCIFVAPQLQAKTPATHRVDKKLQQAEMVSMRLIPLPGQEAEALRAVAR
jgi:hypothetical protein